MVGFKSRKRGLQSTELCDTNDTHDGFIHDTEHGYNVCVLRLRDEFRDNPNVIHSALGVGYSHDPPEEVNRSKPPGVIGAYGYGYESNFFRNITKTTNHFEILE